MNRTGIAVSRREAIEALGVRYTHSGRAGSSVRERLGAIGVPEDPLNPVVTFSTDEEALHYAVELTRETARKEALDASLELEAFRGSWRVWLARHWNPARRWFNQDLAAVAILERRIAAAGKLISGASFVSIERLDDAICIPATLAAGTTVFAVDTSAFPNRPVTLQPMVISEVHYLETPGHPLFHVVPRYKIEGMPGYYAYDHTDSDEEALASPSARGPTMYLDEGAAQRRVSIFVNAVMDMLDRGAQPAIMLPPPAPMAAIEMNSIAPMDRLEGQREVAAVADTTVAPQAVIEVTYEVHQDTLEGSISMTAVVDNEQVAQTSLESCQPPQQSGEAEAFTSTIATAPAALERSGITRQADGADGIQGERALEDQPEEVMSLQPEDQPVVRIQPTSSKPARGLFNLLRLIGGKRSTAGSQADGGNQLVAIDPTSEIETTPSEFARFAANGVKIRRWDNADGRESLARIALETLA